MKYEKTIKFNMQELDLIKNACEMDILRLNNLLQDPLLKDRLELFENKISVLVEIIKKVN